MFSEENKDTLLKKSLLKYFQNNIIILYFLFNNKNTLSLRVLDWLVTNYSKKYNICYMLNGKNYNLYLNYKNQLKAYSKKYFDPFCRRDRIVINLKNLSITDNLDSVDNIDSFITTIGQLNFFRWFIENKVMDYTIENIKDIDKDMNQTLQNKTNKRKELSSSKLKTICIVEQKTVISFK